MSDKENFEKWFKRPLERLWKDQHAGFVILMITLPLLERHLRELTGIGNHLSLDNRFYEELVKLFPDISGSNADPKTFWRVYRHGLLHQASLKLTDDVNSIGVHQNEGKPVITAEHDGAGWNFQVKPVEFSQKVIEAIEKDFATFVNAAKSPDHHFASVTLAGTKGFSGASKP